jgi:hypothetical protein
MERFFLAYANASLKSTPQPFHKLFEQLDPSILCEEAEDDITIDKTELNKIIEYIIDLSEITDSQAFLYHIEKHGSINHYDDRFNEDLYYAVHAIAGERERFYSNVNIWKERKLSKKGLREFIEHDKKVCFECDLRKVVTRYIGKDLCEESFLQKCYECHQLNFRDCLLQIVNGREYLEIPNFRDVWNWSEEISSAKTSLGIEEKEKGEPFRQILSGDKFLFPIFYEFARGPLGNSYHTFNNFIFSLASYSLTEFLISNDRRKLKFCPYCEKFFIAKDIKRKHRCYSQNCMKKWERDKKRFQRETDPVKYV